MTAEQAVEAYARERMARGELLTWRFDTADCLATLYVPDDVEIASFPSRIAGIQTEVKQLPRPLRPGRAASG